MNFMPASYQQEGSGVIQSKALRELDTGELVTPIEMVQRNLPNAMQYG